MRRTSMWTLAMPLLLGAWSVGSARDAGAASDSTEADTLWAAESPSHLLWHVMLPDGNLIVAADSGLACYEAATGRVSWRFSTLAPMTRDRVEIYPWQPYALVYPPPAPASPSLYGRPASAPAGPGPYASALLLDLRDGGTLWSVEATGLSEILGSFILPQVDGLLAYGPLKETGPEVMALVDLHTGRPRWVREHRDARHLPEPRMVGPTAAEARRSISGEQAPFWLPDSSFLEVWSTAGLHRISAMTGDTLWTSDANMSQTPARSKGYGPIVLSADSHSVYVPCKSQVQRIALSDGKRIWQQPSTLPRGAQDIVETPRGIVVRGGGGLGGLMGNKPVRHYLTAIDANTGRAQWKRPMEFIDDAPFKMRNDSLVYIGGKQFGGTYDLMAINTADGTKRIIVKKLRLDGHDSPYAIAVSDSGCRVVGNNNMSFYTWDGVRRMHSFQRQPEASALRKFGLFTASLAASVALSAAMPSFGMGGGSYYYYQPMVIVGFNNAPRWVAAHNEPEYLYRVTNVYGGDPARRQDTGVVKLAVSDGKVVRRARLDTKSPDYIVDSFGERLFFFSEDNRIVCFRF